MQREQLAEELQEARRQLAERDRQIEELREQLEAQRLQRELEGDLQEPQNQLAEHDRQLQERRERMRAQWLADGVRRRRVVPERNANQRDLGRVINFVENELGDGHEPRPRPDDREWRLQRAKTIRTLNELREKLDTICVRAHYGRAIGNGVEIVGAGGAIAGAIMSLSGLPSGPTYVNAGNLLYNAGNLIDGVSNIIESVVSVKYLRDIEEVLKEDQELSRPLAEWLQYSNELDANVEALFGVSLASEQFNTVMKVIREFVNLYSPVRDFRTTIGLMREGRYSVHIGTNVQLETLENLFRNLSTCPGLASRIRPVANRLARGIELYRNGNQLYQEMNSISSSSVVPSLQGGPNPGIPTARQVRVFCVFQTINMASSVISLINAASIIRHGKSKYSDAIEQLIRPLSAELRMMEEL